jgi:FixJ family two-component response regulator
MAASEFVVFLVDDDPSVLRALSRLLQSAGYKIKAYSSPQTFLAEHDPSVPGCIVLDLVMPDLTGLDVQQALARQGIDRPIIFLTGHATIRESVLAMKSGAIDFLSKPVDQSNLLRAVKLAEERDSARRR